MDILLDTHVLLWWLDFKSALRQPHRDTIDNPNNRIYVSLATIWEISIKSALKKLNAPDDLIQLLRLNDINILPMTVDHVFAVRDLPLLHGDPFDRMLVVQAMLENLTLMTHDKRMSQYSIAVMSV